jgi:hypothetical protein
MTVAALTIRIEEACVAPWRSGDLDTLGIEA